MSFFSVYIDEAHPKDGWALGVNKDDGVCIMRPKSMEARLKAAKLATDKYAQKFPTLVDLMDNNTCSTWEAWPERLYVLKSGKIAFKGGPGPFGYDIDALEAWLTQNVD